MEGTTKKEELLEAINNSYLLTRKNIMERMTGEETDHMFGRLAVCYLIKDYLVEHLADDRCHNPEKEVAKLNKIMNVFGRTTFIEGLYEELEDVFYDELFELIDTTIQNLE